MGEASRYQNLAKQTHNNGGADIHLQPKEDPTPE